MANRTVARVTVTLRNGVPSHPRLVPDALCSAQMLQDALAHHPPVTVTLNNNVSRLVGLRYRNDTLQLSLHWALADQGAALLDLLVHQTPGASARVQLVHKERTQDQPPRKRPQPTVRTAGRHHDLAALLDDVHRRHLPSAPPAKITWGRRGRRPRRARSRSLRFGSHDSTGLIRIHPVLDHPTVPAWFVAYVIFHELLHGEHPPEPTPSGRRRVHPPTFREAERLHPDYARAERWRQVHLTRLIALSDR